MDWCSTQVLDFHEPDSSSVNNSIPKSQAAVLKVLAYQGFPETTHPIYTGVNTVGRGAECSIQIMIPSISSEHATIEIIDDCHLISDLGSRNKTKRGKVFLKPNIKYELKFDDIITFGDVVCQYIQPTELIGDGTFLSDHEVSGLATDLILHSDSDPESNSGIVDTSFPVVSETPFNALHASGISSNNSRIKLDLNSDSETDIDEDIKNDTNNLKEAVKEKKNLERADTSSLNEDKEESKIVDKVNDKKGVDSDDSYNSDFETQPLPWAKRLKEKPKVSDDDTDADDEFFNMATQRFPGNFESHDEEMLIAETQIFSSDMGLELPKADEEKKEQVENTSISKIDEAKNISGTLEAILPKLGLKKDKQENNTSTPKISEDNKIIEESSSTVLDSILTKLSAEKGKQVENDSISKIDEENELVKAEVSVQSAGLETPMLMLKNRDETVAEVCRSPELINTSQYIEESILCSSDDENVDETTDNFVISPAKDYKSAKNLTSVEAVKDVVVGKKIIKKPEEPSKKPERISLRSSTANSKKSEGDLNFSAGETLAFTSVVVNSIATSTPKKSPIKKGKSPIRPVKSPLKSPKSAKRNKRKSTPRKLVLTEEDEDFGDRKSTKRNVLFDSSSEDEKPAKVVKAKRITRKSVAERKAESKTPEPIRKSARDIKKPVKFREEEQSSGSSSTPISRRPLKCVIKTTRKVEMMVEESQSSISSTPPSSNLRVSKAVVTPPNETTRASVNPRASVNTRATTTPKRASKRNVPESPIESLAGSGSSIDFIETTPTKRARRAFSQAPKITFTGMKTTKSLEKIVRDLGGEVVDSVSDCTHLVTDKIRRTCKLLCGISLGCHVVSPEWLKASKEEKRFVTELDYLVKDEEAEDKFGFVLETSLSRAAAKIRFLSNFNVHVTKSVLPPPDEMKCIIESAGGKYLARMPAKSSKAGSTVIVCSEKDLKSCDKARKAGVNIVTPEFVLTGVLRQKAELTAFNT